MDLWELDRHALDAAGRFVDLVTPDRLGGPTPCGDWTLEVLLRHMVASNHGFAAAARGSDPDPAVWEDADLGGDPAAAYRRSADEVVAAFAAARLADHKFKIYGYGVFAAPTAVGMHFVDFLVHGWDVAASIGAPRALDAELSDAALAIALRWPYHRPDKAFGVRVPVPAEAPVDQRLVAYLGRDPGWSATER
ncbi:MAG TPA: TIGR03086 family metal-binding protein [Pilimelia sp.]|nr:TIGR03086 family metal-binding protein [Pilimelia sp.]